MKKLLSLLVVGTLVASLVGCDGTDKQTQGVVAGGVIGGLVGSQFGHGTGRALATGVGVLTGALIGGRIGQYMDKTDQLKIQQTLEYNHDNTPTAWVNPNSHNQYTVVPVRTYQQEGRPCREYTTSAVIGGKRQQVYGTACRTADGAWRIVQ